SPQFTLVVAGLLVGAGTRVGRGCTSGHGICGLARFSRRSAVAVACFMGAAMITVFVTRHVVG
ncbi:MAG: YeeE/YedE thiosulfate transporter family protein, partial [Bauldia sp.]